MCRHCLRQNVVRQTEIGSSGTDVLELDSTVKDVARNVHTKKAVVYMRI